MANKEVKRYDLGGKYTHSDYYDEHGKLVGRSVDRTGYDGEYKRTDNYDRTWNKTGTTKK